VFKGLMSSSEFGLNHCNGLESNVVIKWPAKLFPLRELHSSNHGRKTGNSEVLRGLPLSLQVNASIIMPIEFNFISFPLHYLGLIVIVHYKILCWFR